MKNMTEKYITQSPVFKTSIFTESETSWQLNTFSDSLGSDVQLNQYVWQVPQNQLKFLMCEDEIFPNNGDKVREFHLEILYVIQSTLQIVDLKGIPSLWIFGNP